MHSVFRSFITLSLTVTLLACSDDSSNSVSTTQIQGWVGAQGLNSAQVVVNQVSESGQVAIDANGLYVGLRESTDVNSRFVATIADEESTLLIARGQIADVDKDNSNLATSRQCQLKLGCSVNNEAYAFAEYYPATSGYEWRSILFNAENGSRNNVNAITTLATAFAYEYDVKSNDLINIKSNGVFTPYDIVLANSQLSKILGITEIVGDLPANLTRLNFFNSAYAGAQNQIRYGALLSGLQALELDYMASALPANAPDFITKIATEYADDKGQLYYRTSVETNALTLEALYSAAYENLLAIAPTVTNSNVKQLVDLELIKLAENRDVARQKTEDTTTEELADDITLLLTSAELSGISLGLEKTKLFVESINDFQANFWEEGYKAEIDAYRTMIEGLSNTHRATLDALVQDFALIQEYYVVCSIGARDCGHAKYVDIAALNPSYDAASKVLTLDSGAITVSQQLASLSVTSSAAVTASNAVDVLIVGTLKKGNLILKLNHTYNDADETDINMPSSMRIYYPEKVTEVPQADVTIEGYEVIWSDFQLYDQSVVGSNAEAELSGSYKAFYRGVRDPQDPDNSDLRFNLESWALSSIISDVVSDTESGSDATTLIVSAKASNPDTFYPSVDTVKQFANLDGFYTANNDVKQDDIAGLLTYRVGIETVVLGSTTIDVEIIDFLNSMGKDIRYRFYPDSQIEDRNDANGNGNTNELITMHLVEECELVDGSETNIKCGAKSRIYESRDLQKTINNLWKLGAFQKTTVDGRGDYSVTFPTQEIEGCLNLEPLVGTGSLEGSLIEQQVLGLDSLRLTSEVSLQNNELVSLPGTLFDMTIVAPTKDKYTVNLALSHNYTGTAADSSASSEVILGSGSNTNVLRFGYDTSADFSNSGSHSVFQGGVELTLASGSQITENQDITAFFSQTYNGNVNYKIVENEEGVAERCVLPVNSAFEKTNLADQVYYLNYRGLVYGTARLSGTQNVWTVSYIDGTSADMTWALPPVPLMDVSGASPVLDIND